MKRIQGFIRWYDASGDHGIVTDFEGNDYYMNSWSFPETHYKVTGISKKTKKKVTIKTWLFPGLFRDRTVYPDPICETIAANGGIYASGVSFVQAPKIERPWAIEIKLEPELTNKILETRYEWTKYSLSVAKKDPRPFYRKLWTNYYQKHLKRLENQLAKRW